MEFHEKQYMRQIWVWALIIGVNLLVIGAFIGGYYHGFPPGKEKATLVTMAISFGTLMLSNLMLLTLCLETIVTDTSIKYKMFPFIRWREIPFSDIQSITVKKYSPLWEYGGWGIRMNGRKSWAYSTSGNQGLFIERKNGSKILIGTHKQEELAEVIARVKIG
jgi:hypothetical protein